jgi:hypothetical protein
MIAAENYFLTVFSSSTFEEFFIEVEECLFLFQDREFIDEFMDDIFYTIMVLLLDPDIGEITIRRIFERFAFCESVSEKIFIVPFREDLDESSLWGKCLEQDRNLLFDIISDLCIRPLFHIIFGSREIRFEEAEYDESEVFGNESVSELGRDDNLGTIEVFYAGRFMSLTIGIETEYIRLRKEFRDGFFYFLDTDPDRFQICSVTFFTSLGNRMRSVALMAQ